MTTSLSSSVFASSPKLQEAAVDVYEKTDAVVVNSYQNFVSSFEDVKKLFSYFSPDKAKEGVNIVEDFDIKNGLKIDKDTLSERIVAASDGIGSGVKSAMETFSEYRDSLMEFYTENKNKVTGIIKTARDIQVRVGNVKKAIDQAKLTDIKSIGNVINAIKQNSDFKIEDNEMLSGIYASVVDQSMKLGIPDAFKSIKETLVGDEGMIRSVASKILPAALAEADYDTIKEIASVYSANAISLMKSSAVQDILKRTGLQPHSNDISSKYTDIINTLGLVDSDWNKLTRNPNTETPEILTDISKILKGSDDVREIIAAGSKQTGSAQDRVMAVVNKLRAYEVDDQIKKQIPGFATHQPQANNHPNSPQFQTHAS